MALHRSVSKSEQQYICAGCIDGVRFDGRGRLDFRSWTIENNILPHVNGSSRFKIHESTDIICSVKVEVTETLLSSPDKGLVEFSVDISPGCNLRLDERRLTDISSQIVHQLKGIYLPCDAVPAESLCIIPGKFCWLVHVDFMILQCDGDPLDACSVAALVALQCAKIPKLELSIGESGVPEYFEVSSDLSEAVCLDTTKVPLVISAHQIGSSFVLDAVGAEQASASSSISVAVDRSGNCCGIIKQMGGTLSVTEILGSLEKCTGAAQQIFSQLDDYVAVLTASETECGDGFVAADAPATRIGLLA